MLHPFDYAPSRVTLDLNGKAETLELFPEKLEFVGSGTYGIVFGDGKLCVKITDKDEIEPQEVELSYALGKRGYGPKLVSYGMIELPAEYLRKLLAQVSSDHTPRFTIVEPTTEAIYICYEQWDCTLSKAWNDLDITEETFAIVLDKWKCAIQQIHLYDYYHLDIVGNNILVKIKDNKIVDLCITDCGIATQTHFWFLENHYGNQDRLNVVTRFEDMPLTELLQKKVRAAGKGTKIPLKKRFQYWLLNDPKNIDYCLFASICHFIGKPELYPVTFPQQFNFSLPWNPSGLLQVQVHAKCIKVVVWICAFDSLARFRTVLEKNKISKFKRLRFCSTKGIIPRTEETKLLPSCVIRQKRGSRPNYVIKMM